MHFLRSILLFLLFVLRQSYVEELSSSGAAGGTIASFPVLSGGDRVLLPVKIADKTYRFLVDTGTTQSVFDRTLPLGRLRRSAIANSASGDRLTIEIFEAPVATIGPLSLDCPDRVLSLDLTPFGPIIGEDVHGLIGTSIQALSSKLRSRTEIASLSMAAY